MSPAVELYKETDPRHRNRKLLKALTPEPATFADLAPKLPNKDGSHLTNGQMHAVYRNLKRTEKRLRDEGVLPRRFVRSNFDRYDADGGGRYYLSKEDFAALNRHLGR